MNLFKLKKDGKVVGYESLKNCQWWVEATIGDGGKDCCKPWKIDKPMREMTKEEWDYLEFCERLPFVCEDKNGEKVFAGEKSKCSTCHRVGEIGKPVGPDLTTIGRNRSASDLLESIVFPSASIVRDFESHKVLTVDGRAMVGLIVSETSDSIELQQPSGEREKLNQEDIEQIIPSAVSIMPAGLDEALSEQELLDVVQFLQRAK